MKRIYKFLFLLLCPAPLFLVSCSNNDMELNKGEQALILSVDSADVVLDVSSPGSNVLTFTWTPGSNRGTNAAISYSFELALKGSNFSKFIRTNTNNGTTSVTYTNEELNTLLVDSFGVAIGSKVGLEARVISTVHDTSVQSVTSNVIDVNVTTYLPVSKTLYMIGDATPNSWSADKATAMNSITGTAGGFTWQGYLNKGELKFITALGSFVPSYGMGKDSTLLYYRQSADDPNDPKFEITKSGTYSITLNLITMSISIVAAQGPEYSNLWFVGNATGWNFVQMTVDPIDSYVFHYNADLSAGGGFKIGTVSGDFSAVFLRPSVDGTGAGTSLPVVKWAGDPDNKWNISGGVYKIKLNLRTMTMDIVKFTPYNMIYLIGDATSKGWDIANAVPMTKVSGNPYQFTWTGILNAGGVKFTCDKQIDWNGAWFLAGSSDKTPTGSTEQMIFSYPGSNPDNKWKISNAGTYTILLDQLKETVIFTKQ